MKATSRRMMAGVALLAVATAGCSAEGRTGASGDLVVSSSVAPLVDLVQTVAGNRAEVRGIVPPGEDGHTYQPRPSDARALSESKMFIDNGLGLNEAVRIFAAANLPENAETVWLAESVPVDGLIGAPGGCHEGHCHGPVNGHLWPDPAYAAIYTGTIADVLTRADAEGADEFRRNADTLKAQIENLDRAIKTATATVAPENRKLVVYHDAWAYFARRYGYQMIGALQVANFAEPSAGEVRAMIEQIKTERVPAFFGSEVFPSDVLDAVAEATGAKYVPDLSDDRLPGKKNDADHSYVGMMTENAKLIVGALGGDIAALEAFERNLE